MKGNKWKGIYVSFFILVIFFSFKYFNFFINPEFFIEACSTFGVFNPIIIILAMIFQALIAPIPSSAIAIGSGALCGVFRGAIYVWIGGIIGASMCFFISKRYGRSYVKKKFNFEKIKKIDDSITRYGFYAILVARLIPLISFDIVSYVAGLTSIGFRRFFVATMFGMIPGTMFYTWLGVSFLRLEVFGLIFTIIMLLALVYYLKS